MQILNLVSEYKNSLKEYVEFCLKHKIDINKILTSTDFTDIVVSSLLFFETKKIYIIAEENGYVVYKIENNIRNILICEFKEDVNIANKYVIAIIETFKYLNAPF